MPPPITHPQQRLGTQVPCLRVGWVRHLHLHACREVHAQACHKVVAVVGCIGQSNGKTVVSDVGRHRVARVLEQEHLV